MIVIACSHDSLTRDYKIKVIYISTNPLYILRPRKMYNNFYSVQSTLYEFFIAQRTR